MRYAVIENEIVVNIAEAEPEIAEPLGWVLCPDHDETGRAINPGDGYSNGKFFLSEKNRQLMAEAARSQRDAFLIASDIHVLPDRWAAMSDEQKAGWSTYRQALRDVPAQVEFPINIAWPTQPTP